MSNNLFRVYRRGDDPATSRDWAVRATDTAVEIRTGQTARPATLTVIPRERCTRGAPDAELDALADRKVAEGFKPVGWGSYPRGKLVMEREDPVAGDELYWEIRRPISNRRLRNTVSSIADDLNSAGLNAALIVESAAGGGTAPSGVLVTTPAGEWKIGGCEGGGLNKDGRGGGIIHRADGVLPVLVLMRFAREFPEFVGFADGRAEEVAPELKADDPWIGEDAGPTDLTQQMATALGLCLSAEVVVNQPDADRPIFF